MIKTCIRITSFVYALSLLINPLTTFSCTGIRLKAKDGSIIYARTMDFVAEMDPAIVIIPRNHTFIGTVPSQKQEGLRWKSNYAAVGANAFHANVLLDGLNEKGLAGGCFYFPGYAEFQEVTRADYKKTLAPWELLTWILTNFSSVKEAITALPNIKVCKVLFPGLESIAPVIHFVLHDITGACAVIEYMKGGQLTIHDNVLGIITNAPDFTWHMTNLSNYINLSSVAVPKLELSGFNISPLGHGSGMLGLPGDVTSPSRFVKAVAFSQASVAVKNADEALHQGFHVLNQFDIIRGIARTVQNGKTNFDYTQWTAACDLRNKKYYFHTFDNRQVRVVDLIKCNHNAKSITTIPMKQKEVILDITPKQNAGK